jgi:histidine kinase
MLKEVAAELTAQVRRAERIINHLREFGRKAQVARGRVDINQPIQGVFHLLGQQLHLHDIEVKLELSKDPPLVWADANRLEQVFINLVLNARDAIEDRRKAEPGLAGQITVRSERRDGQARVSIGDNGAGIPAELTARIFEPFFTTKEVGRGTGLGLSISYGIVRDYGGSIAVESAPGQGTTFRLELPAAGEEEAAA